MIPILLSGTTVKGFLSDALTCVVTEERNGIYELSLTYPVTGALFSELAVERFVKAKPNDTSDLQLFRIYEITKPLNGVVTVNGEHFSYALSRVHPAPLEHIPFNGAEVLQRPHWKSHRGESRKFRQNAHGQTRRHAVADCAEVSRQGQPLHGDRQAERT